MRKFIFNFKSKEDFDSETDYNLYNQRQQDNNLVDQLRNTLSKRYDIAQQRGEMLDDASLYSKTEYEALTEAQNSIFDYNDPMNEEFRLEMDSIAPVSYTHLTLPTKA